MNIFYLLKNTLTGFSSFIFLLSYLTKNKNVKQNSCLQPTIFHSFVHPLSYRNKNKEEVQGIKKTPIHWHTKEISIFKEKRLKMNFNCIINNELNVLYKYSIPQLCLYKLLLYSLIQQHKYIIQKKRKSTNFFCKVREEEDEGGKASQSVL